MNNSRPAELKTLIQTTTGRSSSTNPGSGGVSRPAGNEVLIGNTTNNPNGISNNNGTNGQVNSNVGNSGNITVNPANNQPSTQVPTNNQTQIPTRSTK